MDTDPTDIKSIAISTTDLVSAVEATADGSETVLRVTPPFSGRMRARLHVVHEDTRSPRPVHVDPEGLLAPEAPAYPRPADTEDELRADPGVTYTRERHREYHADAVAAWREAVRAAVSDRATIETPAGPTEVEIHLL